MAKKIDLKHLENFRFTRQWFRRRNMGTFTEFVHPHWSGRQSLTYLEIGVFEGMSLVWMLQNVLTDETSRAVGIDPWLCGFNMNGDYLDEVMQRALANTEPFRARCQLIRANSCDILRRMQTKGGFLGIGFNDVDICLIDGAHYALSVLDDARQSFKLLKPGGWLIFDDVVGRHAGPEHVRGGIDLFVAETGNGVKKVFAQGYLEAWEKIE